jgi:glycosyltransferase involved in cell wall biosynthesis
MNEQSYMYVAIPAMDEFETIERTLQCIKNQTFRNFHVYVCVNQPEVYHDAPAYAAIVESNKKTMELLSKISDFQITIIDKSSRGNGWDEKNHGVGWARKVLFDTTTEIANANDIILSLDADTVFENTYFENIVKQLHTFPLATAISNPYYHPLSGNEELDRLMLRYEIYMRYYALNLWRIDSPYCFSALGSAIAFPAHAYTRIRGLAPKFSGEDFYLLQKLRKSGRVIHHNEECVFPETRYSSRVFFGTGPALIKGRTGDWSSYPFYSPILFDKIEKLYHSFHVLFEKDVETEADEFIRQSFSTEPTSLWSELRQYNREKNRFVHACHVKFDGLRILQFLRFYHFKNQDEKKPQNELLTYLTTYHNISANEAALFEGLDFQNSTLQQIDKARDVMFSIEKQYRLNDYEMNLQTKNPQRWKYLGS